MKILFERLRNLYVRKDLRKEGRYIVCLALLLEYLPDMYRLFPACQWKSLFAILTLLVFLILSWRMVGHLLCRYHGVRPGKTIWIQFLKRFMTLNVGLLLLVLLQMGILYPSFFVAQGNKLMEEKRIWSWILQSVSFSAYAQGFAAACMVIENNLKEWLIVFFKFHYQTILWMTLLTCLVIAVSHGLYEISEIAGQIGSVFFTAFLWMTVIAAQERKSCYEI